MMAQPPFSAGMGGPGHSGIPHGHPMGVPHPAAGHMGGQPGPGMMQGMHPGVAGPQVSQGPMVAGMPPGGGTQAPMQQNGMAMPHLGPQQHMFAGHNPQMNLGQMQQMNQAALMQQRLMMSRQAGMPMNGMNPPFQQQIAHMKMGMPMQPQQQQHMQMQMQNLQQQQQQQQQFQQHQQQQQQQQQHQQMQQQQRMMAQQMARQQAMKQAHAQAQAQQAQNQQQAAAQQMQMSRSQEQTTQPPQPMPTPAPTSQPQPQPQPNVQAQQQPPQQPPKPQPTPQPAQQQTTPAPSVKADGDGEETQIKQQDATNPIMMQDIPKQQQPNDFTGQCILQLLLYQDKLANPERATDLAYWEDIIHNYFSSYGSIRQQLYNNKLGNDKSFQLQYPSLARFFYIHFTNGIKQILMQSFDHNQVKLSNGGIQIWSHRASLTYVFHNDLRVTTQGSLRVNFDDMQKIEHLYIATTGWTEYIPRNILVPASPTQNTSPKLTQKNAKKTQKAPMASVVIPPSNVGQFGLPAAILQFLEIAEVMMAMGPLMEFFNSHPGMSPREALKRISSEGPHINNMLRMQNANMMAQNGQMGFPPQRMGMNMPTQLQSPALQHLGLPHGQGSPGMNSNHTGSPAQNQAASMPMMTQMSAQGSNMSGSHGPSTNTSPNVSNKRRRASNVKMEDENGQQDPNGSDKVKPSPGMGGKRQKGQA